MGASQYELIAANGIVNPDLIYVGQELTNPGCGALGAVPYAEAPAMAADYAAVEAYAGAEMYDGAGMEVAYDMPATDAYGAEYATAGYGAEAYMGDGYAATAYPETMNVDEIGRASCRERV